MPRTTPGSRQQSRRARRQPQLVTAGSRDHSPPGDVPAWRHRLKRRLPPHVATVKPSRRESGGSGWGKQARAPPARVFDSAQGILRRPGATPWGTSAGRCGPAPRMALRACRHGLAPGPAGGARGPTPINTTSRPKAARVWSPSSALLRAAVRHPAPAGCGAAARVELAGFDNSTAALGRSHCPAWLVRQLPRPSPSLLKK
jgi:hypothetical protein